MTTADADTHGRPGKPQGWARGFRAQGGRARHLHGKGNFVADMAMPGLSEVAFLRSPLAHARIASVRVASQIADKAFVRQAMADARDIVADSTLPSYQVSAQPPLASGGVRFVGEPVAMVVAPTRAEAEDYAELIEVDYDDLPVYADVASAPGGARRFRARAMARQRLRHAQCRQAVRRTGGAGGRGGAAQDRPGAAMHGADGGQGGAGLLGPSG